jgi:hypothetical protein
VLNLPEEREGPPVETFLCSFSIVYFEVVRQPSMVDHVQKRLQVQGEHILELLDDSGGMVGACMVSLLYSNFWY